MRVTVCELPNRLDELTRAWEALVRHAHDERSELVLLPEMPFAPWLARRRMVDPAAWDEAVAAHDAWLGRLTELAPAAVLGTRPVLRNGVRQNEGFVWELDRGYAAAHTKYYLPNEVGFWEASWYTRGGGEFKPVMAGAARVGFAICTELWFMERARQYGKQGVQILAVPRATPRETLDKWLAGGRAAAVIAGAFVLSSNRWSAVDEEANLGGQGWIIDPEGSVLCVTTPEQPFLTREVDLAVADLAKTTYPRYVAD